METHQDQYTRKQGLQLTYDVEYSAIGYRVTLNGKELQAKQPIHTGPITGVEANWVSAISDIEYLRGMSEE